jgi:midasin (ATPase involved in ribosome maturation)
MLYAALIGREIQYVSLTQDTSEADLKQRKEVTNGRAIYIDQAPVLAAKHGRLLVLDGLEKAERNVLPTLNNLMENREMNLDDGSMLVSHNIYDAHTVDTHDNISRLNIHRVHPDFRVAALVSFTPGESVTLDPPLRSRFQGRYTPAVDIGNLLTTVSAQSRGLLDSKTFRNVIQTVGQIPFDVPVQSVHDAIRYFESYQDHIDAKSALDAHGINSNGDMIEAMSVRVPFNHDLKMYQNVPEFIGTKTIQNTRDLILAAFQNGSRAVVCVGPKGCYKSALAKETARVYGAKVELFTLYTDLTSRDMLMVRGTDIDSGDTVWRETPLAKAIRCGHWVILDGVDKLRSDVLSSIAIMIEQGWIDLPNGNRIYAHENFRCIAIAHPPDEKSWITPEIKSIFHWIDVAPLPSDELSDILKTLYPSLDNSDLSMIMHLKDLLDGAVFSGAADSTSGKESLVLTLRKMKHICRRLEQGNTGDLSKLVHNTLMTEYMPDIEKRVLEKCLERCGISKSQGNTTPFDVSLDEELLIKCHRNASNPLLVPNPTFEENPGQAQVMNDILEAHSAGEKALLISGYQGVGKNRVVDYLLSLLNCEREYLQLHRDTTVQSLMSSPSVENGRIVYHDSPLLRAAKFGRILVLDEADKAPLEVVALLKGLIEDGQLTLPDGRTLRERSDSDVNSVQIHPDFRIWTLINPSGFPFHGNDLAKEMSDVFSCHHVKVMDIESHRRILHSYGSNVSSDTIEKIITIWDELRKAHEDGIILYPFSVRESVNVVKHLNMYSKDGIEDALENVLSFDRLDTALSNQLKQIFDDHGISVFSESSFHSNNIYHAQGAVSTPKTRVSSPKHGQVDPENVPHVGGNTWAGGTGGSDTAGLGGRGGPYRIDAGHKFIKYQMK